MNKNLTTQNKKIENTATKNFNKIMLKINLIKRTTNFNKATLIREATILSNNNNNNNSNKLIITIIIITMIIKGSFNYNQRFSVNFHNSRQQGPSMINKVGIILINKIINKDLFWLCKWIHGTTKVTFIPSS